MQEAKIIKEDTNVRILFLGSNSDAVQLLSWTAEQDGAEIVGVVGDEPLTAYAKNKSYSVYSLETASARMMMDSGWAELVVSYLYWRILKPPIIDIPKYGCINFHPAPLPDYNGRAGCSFAILDRLSEWGCTAHYINEGIDTGNIIKVKRFPFDWRQETGISLKKKTFMVQAQLYKEVMGNVLKKGRVECIPQDLSKGRYISTQAMLAAMEVTEKDDIDAKIQAFWFPPHDGAYIKMQNGQRYTLVNEIILRQIKINL